LLVAAARAWYRCLQSTTIVALAALETSTDWLTDNAGMPPLFKDLPSPTSPDSVAVALPTVALEAPSSLSLPQATVSRNASQSIVSAKHHWQAVLFVLFIYLVGFVLVTPSMPNVISNHEKELPYVRSSLSTGPTSAAPLEAWTWPTRLPQPDEAKQASESSLTDGPDAKFKGLEAILLMDRLDTSFGMGFY